MSRLQKTARDIADQDDLLGETVAVGCVESCASMLRPPSSALMCRTSWHWYDARDARVYEQSSKKLPQKITCGSFMLLTDLEMFRDKVIYE